MERRAEGVIVSVLAALGARSIPDHFARIRSFTACELHDDCDVADRETSRTTLFRSALHCYVIGCAHCAALGLADGAGIGVSDTDKLKKVARRSIGR